MTERMNRQWRLAARPVGLIKESDFEWKQEPAPVPGPRGRAEPTVGTLSRGPVDDSPLKHATAAGVRGAARRGRGHCARRRTARSGR